MPRWPIDCAKGDINDFTGDLPIGTDADTDASTYKGAINKVIGDIMVARPHIRLLFVGALYTPVATNRLGLSVLDYADALKERCTAFNIPYLEIYRTAGMNALNWSHWSSDGSHPSAAGYALLADKIAGALMTM